MLVLVTAVATFSSRHGSRLTASTASIMCGAVGCAIWRAINLLVLLEQLLESKAIIRFKIIINLRSTASSGLVLCVVVADLGLH